MTDAWQALKTKLVGSGALHDYFVAVPPSIAQSGPSHDPLLVDEHVKRVTTLVHSCLALRKDIRELEILAVKAAAEYSLFQSTSQIDEQIDKHRLFMEAEDAAEKGFRVTASELGAVTHPIAKGLAAAAHTKKTEAQSKLDSSSKISLLLTDRWTAVRAYQDEYNSRTLTKGNAHNYAERAVKLHAVLSLAMQEMLARAQALSTGLETLYSDPQDVPKTVSIETLDELSLWIMAADRRLAARRESESTFELTIPLTQPWSSASPLVVMADLEKSVTDSKHPIKFRLTAGDFLGLNPRLRAFGLSFGNEFILVGGSGIDSAQTADSFVRLTALVSTPTQNLSSGGKLVRSPFLFGDIRLHSGAEPTMVEGPTVSNLNPAGEWTIRLHPRLVWKDSSEKLLADGVLGNRLKDIKLRLVMFVPAM